MFRQFHVEGFVNTYVQDLEAKTGTVVFVSEGIENIPPGYRARETYIFNGPDEVEEVFELAEPSKEFALYLAHETQTSEIARRGGAGHSAHRIVAVSLSPVPRRSFPFPTAATLAIIGRRPVTQPH